MERLTSFDASFLANEKGNGHMAIGAVIICEGECPGEVELLDHLEGRLHRLPRFRQRLAVPPLQLGRPFWVDDPDFDPSNHLRRETLPPPGDEALFRAKVDELLAPPLDRDRPLWQLCLIDGLAGDRFGLIYRVHHALADGFSAVDIAAVLFDLQPEAGPAGKGPEWKPAPPPTPRAMARRALGGLGASVARSAAWLAGAARDPGRAKRAVADGFAGLGEVARAMAKPAPKVPLNAEIDRERQFAWTGRDLGELKAVANALGGTVNDVSLTACAGALRRWFIDRGLATDGMELKALVPVSLRSDRERGTLGNRLTALRGPLPLDTADPVQRLRKVSAAMRELKDSRQALGAQTIWRINDWFRDFAPPILFTPTAAINFSPRIFNLLVTNFPGPPKPLYLLGRKMVGIYPVGFLARRQRLAVAIISYAGSVNFGLLTDGAGPDPELLTDHLEREFEELLATAQAL